MKRREAAFLLGATAFRTREMQKCASPFVEVRQIEFLARETPNYTLPRTCTHIPSMDMRERERFASPGSEATRERIRSVAMIHRMTETEPQGSVNTTCPSTRTNVRFLSSLGRLVLSSMLDAKEQGRSARGKHHHTFLESRYRSSDVGRARLQTGEAHLFISAPSGDIAHYTLLRKVVRQARHLCAQSAALMCLMGTPHTPLYARRTVRITGTSGGFPSPRKAAPTQRIMMPSSP